eukprot:scaffold577_cov16-Tisochrysis_lutea.AAC.1
MMLRNLNGLEQLQRVGGDLIMNSNMNLKTVDGLQERKKCYTIQVWPHALWKGHLPEKQGPATQTKRKSKGDVSLEHSCILYLAYRRVVEWPGCITMAGNDCLLTYSGSNKHRGAVPAEGQWTTQDLGCNDIFEVHWPVSNPHQQRQPRCKRDGVQCMRSFQHLLLATDALPRECTSLSPKCYGMVLRRDAMAS